MQADFWTSSAEAMELTIEGNRLIARELADMVRGLWGRLVHALDVMNASMDQHRHLPPV